MEPRVWRRRSSRYLPLPWLIALMALAMAAPPGPVFAEDNGTPVTPAFPPFPEPAPLPGVTAREGGPLRVVTSTAILADLVRQIGGERVAVVSILPANADPHDYEPAPEDVVQIEEASLIVVHGLHLDEWIERLIDTAEPAAPVVVATAGIATRAAADEEFAAGDPHVWFDPARTKTLVANLAAGLADIDPAGAADYDARSAAYQAILDELDAAIAERIALIPPERRKLVTNHDALGYYAERYGLEIVGTVIPGADARAEPSAKEIAALLETIARTGVTVIFAEHTINPALAEELADQAGIAVVAELYTDNLGEPDSGAYTYLGLMQTDTRIIVEALQNHS